MRRNLLSRNYLVIEPNNVGGEVNCVNLGEINVDANVRGMSATSELFAVFRILRACFFFSFFFFSRFVETRKRLISLICASAVYAHTRLEYSTN